MNPHHRSPWRVPGRAGITAVEGIPVHGKTLTRVVAAQVRYDLDQPVHRRAGASRLALNQLEQTEEQRPVAYVLRCRTA
jgi:hypothetical protein